MEIALIATAVVVVVGALMILMTVLPLSRADQWWIRSCDFPRLQIAVIAAICLVSFWWLQGATYPGGRAFLVALGLCIALQAYKIFPYTIFARMQVQRSRAARSESTIKLLFANVLMTNRRTDRLREIIRRTDPDVILLVETDVWWQSEMREFEQTHPFIVHQPQENTYGMCFYSRLELVDPQLRFLIEDDIPSIHTRVKLPSGREVQLHCLHPRPPFPTEAGASTERDAEILVVGRLVKLDRWPNIVFGDLNDVAWSRTNDLFQNISGLLDPRIGRGCYNTFHAEYSFIRFPLDHFFHSNHFRLVDFQRLPAFGSDHFPVFIVLSYEPDAESEQEELQADTAELIEVKEKISKAL